jgi:hypothetical protein
MIGDASDRQRAGGLRSQALAARQRAGREEFRHPYRAALRKSSANGGARAYDCARNLTKNATLSCSVVGGLQQMGESVSQPYDAVFWRKRADEARAIAANMKVPGARREMEQIAAAYERLADRAERTAGRKGTREFD